MQSEPSSGIKLTAYSCICWLLHRIEHTVDVVCVSSRTIKHLWTFFSVCIYVIIMILRINTYHLHQTTDKPHVQREGIFFLPPRAFICTFPFICTFSLHFVISKHVPHKYHFPGHLISHKIKEVPHRLLFFEYQEADASSEQRKPIDLYFMYA